MEGTDRQLGPREQQIAELLLQGCSNEEIARQLRMNRRTVKAHFNRLFVRFGISGGVKRVKLATLLYRRSIGLTGEDVGVSLPSRSKYKSLSALPDIGDIPPGIPQA